MATFDPRSLSLWHDSLDETVVPRRALPGDVEADVAVVGAGYTGLWTALHLARTDPSLRVVVLEKEFAGFGASGRNGGWCSALFPTSLHRLAREGGREGAVRLQRVLHRTVPDVGRIAAEEGIDCHFDQGGYLSVARNAAQLQREHADVEEYRSWGFGEADHRLLDPGEVTETTGIAGALGGVYTPHCAAIHPARLVRGLARAVERRGVVVHEGTRATQVASGRVVTPHGTVRAEHVVLATEGYTPTVPGRRRAVAPVYSLMVATEPLADDVLEQVGLRDRTTFSDKRHLTIYGQRTRDGRLAFGGRGAPYHFGSRVQPAFDCDDRVHEHLRGILRELFPVLRDTRFTHAWGGNLGVPRDWFPSVRHDRRTGLGFAGGYVGDGVATAALAGRTLAAMITGEDPDDLASLPWANRSSRSWEPEPLRWLGVNAVTALMTAADRQEQRTGRPSRLASTFWSAVGQ
ncbi:NAD(P)/FAD-dependent oxidoreductase [Terracoccus luteus]|uniref:Glycine/D-amino acid oxidase-like deaminating enzyme n=1 Tax=Terracoccus luteus TaxID=53356 RepID=A0A839PV92_9MICO|nr:FAD-dependent oxidoreductase [Terracoccus luteus]MBB2988040.1 glycine/D-amino acid oxidase-like deaminating enzyme [Terracoccus luteus]MCP2173691.1 glycine/D-amino acid oxidase-like deaminating enzyme [Terracoccus luteus]